MIPEGPACPPSEEDGSGPSSLCCSGSTQLLQVPSRTVRTRATPPLALRYETPKTWKSARSVWRADFHRDDVAASLRSECRGDVASGSTTLSVGCLVSACATTSLEVAGAADAVSDPESDKPAPIRARPIKAVKKAANFRTEPDYDGFVRNGPSLVPTMARSLLLCNLNAILCGQCHYGRSFDLERTEVGGIWQHQQ